MRSIANARPEDIVRVLPKQGNFGTHAAKLIISSARKLLEDKASDLRREAEDMLKAESGAAKNADEIARDMY